LLCLFIVAMSKLVILVFAAACLIVFARGTKTGPCGSTGLSWVFDEDTGTLTIKGNGYMTEFCDMHTIYRDADMVHNVVLEDGVKSVMERTFSGFNYIGSLYIGESLEKFADFVFNSGSLTTIEVSKNNKFFESFDNVMFNKGRTKIVVFPRGREGDYAIPNTVREVGFGAFYGSALTSVYIPSNVTTLRDSSFGLCDYITSIIIPASVTTIEQNAFYPNTKGMGLNAVAYYGENDPGVGKGVIFASNPVVCVYPHYFSKTFCNLKTPLFLCR